MKVEKQRHGLLRNILGIASAFAVLGAAVGTRAQQKTAPVPYDSISSQGVSYAGPARESSFNLPGPTIRIGLLAPLHGPQKASGDAIVTAARMALQDASKRPLPGGLHLALAVADESVPPWGLLGDEIIRLVMREKVVAIVTSADGVTAHLSEQIGNKIGVPVLTLSADPTATQTNMAWIFRLGPSDAQQARVIAWNVYHERSFKRVLLVAGRDHDGRIGGREFIEAANQLGAPAPDSLSIDPLQPDVNSFLGLVKARSPQAIVLWTQPENARKLLQALVRAGDSVPVYLSQKAAQAGSGVTFPQQALPAAATELPTTGIYTVVSSQSDAPSSQSFARRYLLAAGMRPSPVAAEAYEAVRLIAHAVRETGPNRARVRDRILKVQVLAGVSGEISFDEQGNNRASVRLICLQNE